MSQQFQNRTDFRKFKALSEDAVLELTEGTIVYLRVDKSLIDEARHYAKQEGGSNVQWLADLRRAFKAHDGAFLHPVRIEEVSDQLDCGVLITAHSVKLYERFQLLENSFRQFVSLENDEIIGEITVPQLVPTNLHFDTGRFLIER
jgi:hypothetical protein